ncbi:MAG: YchJ family protein [Hyphomicrobiaceae bacterium]
MRCPCRKKSETTSYADCCEPYHAGLRPAPTAEALMRSRYAAFALKRVPYLLATWHPTTRPARIDLDDGDAWVQLRVLAATTDNDEATVEFIARSRSGGRVASLHEISRFVRENGAWLYVDGTPGG